MPFQKKNLKKKQKIVNQIRKTIVSLYHLVWKKNQKKPFKKGWNLNVYEKIRYSIL